MGEESKVKGLAGGGGRWEDRGAEGGRGGSGGDEEGIAREVRGTQKSVGGLSTAACERSGVRRRWVKNLYNGRAARD